MNAVDTNVLLYSHDFRYQRKQAIAQTLVGNLANGALVWQVACEFGSSRSHKLKLKNVVSHDPWREIRVLEGMWSTIVPAWPSLARAESLMTRFSLSHWDAILIAVCLDKGVACLYSEDFSAYPLIDGMRIANPFVP